jgi:putative membrane protein
MELTPDLRTVERPDRSLMKLYVLRSLLLGPLFPILLVPLYFRYHTLRYRFDDDGISMAWGILFRREVHLTYSRIQDIHLVSNIVERWLGLARLQIQTASGSAKAEMTLEGLRDLEAARDFIYARMRGVREVREEPAAKVAPSAAGSDEELAAVLHEIAEELRGVRRALDARER